MKPIAFSPFFARCAPARIVFTCAAITSLASTAFSASATWNGTTDATWATGTNWSATPVPGTGDTATFNNAGNGNTTLDLGAGVTIGSILFDTNSATAYTIGSGTVGSQTLTLGDTGAITVNSAVTNGQTFNSAITLGTAIAGTTTITNNSTAAGLTFNGNITGGTGGTAGIKTLSFGGSGNVTVHGNISRGGATNLLLTKSGAGTLYLNGTTTLRGGFNANVLSLTGGSIQLGNTAVLNITTSDAAFRANLNGSGTISGGSINLSAGTTSTGTLTINSVVTTLGGTIGGTNNKTVLTNASNSFSQNIRISNSTLEASSIGALGTGSSIAFGTVNSGSGTLIYTGGSGTLNMAIIQGLNATTSGTITQSGTGALNVTGAVTNQNTFNLTLNGSTSGTGELSGNISISSGSLTKSGNGIWTLSGNNSALAASTSVNQGILNFARTASKGTGTVTAAAAGSIGLGVGETGYYSAADVGALFNSNSLTGFSLNADSGVAIDTTNATGGAFDQTIALTASRALTKLGTGTLVMSQANTYTGNTTVNGGTLLVNGSLGGSGTVTVNNGATLGGTGSINGAVTINSGGSLASGNSIQSLTTGSLTLTAAAIHAYEMNKDAAPVNAGDLTVVNGNLTLDLNNTAILTLTDLGTGNWSDGDKLTLISYDGSWNGGLFSYNDGTGSVTLTNGHEFAFSGMDWIFSYDDDQAGTNYAGEVNGKFVTMTAIIPEPRAALLVGIGMLMLLRRRR